MTVQNIKALKTLHFMEKQNFRLIRSLLIKVFVNVDLAVSELVLRIWFFTAKNNREVNFIDIFGVKIVDWSCKIRLESPQIKLLTSFIEKDIELGVKESTCFLTM